MKIDVKNWMQGLLDITEDLFRLRGTGDAPSQYNLSYLRGYIESGKVIIDNE